MILQDNDVVMTLVDGTHRNGPLTGTPQLTTTLFSGVLHNIRPVNNAVGFDIRNGTWFQSGRLYVRVFPTNLDYTMTGTLD